MAFEPARLVHTDDGALAESKASVEETGSPEPGTRSSAGEHSLHTRRVAGSIPAASTTSRPCHYGIPNVCVPEGAAGAWRVERFTISEDQADVSNIEMMFRPGGRRIRSGSYTRLMRGSQLVMSDTPDEKRDHAWFVREARGDVLINGLGLGMVLGAVLRKLEVSSVTVVERSADVIKLVGPSYLADRRVTIVQGDAFAWKPPTGVRYGAVWHDIWDDICSDNLPQMHRLHRRYGRRADWQGSWARELCERYR